MYINNDAQMHGLFSKVAKVVTAPVKAALKVTEKVASKVLPDSVEKAVLAVPKAVVNLTTKSTTAVAAAADKAVSPIARGIKKNPAITQAAGAIASVIPGGQPVGAALLTAGRLQQQALAQKEADKLAAQQAADFAKMQADLFKQQLEAQKQSAVPQYATPQAGPTVVTVPGGGGQTAAPAPQDHKALYIGGGLAALAAILLLTNRRG